jgi:phosphoribosyl 1,2-cyclic phosphate phosphodiesterase
MVFMDSSLLFLGTGASAGVPIIGCHCPVCTSKDPKNRRLRASALLRWQDKCFLIDAGPDFRQQALQYDIQRIDGLLLTHTHYDHVGGLEELRIYNARQKSAIPCLLSSASYSEIKKLFYFLFESSQEGNGEVKNYTSKFDFKTLEEKGEVSFLGLPVRYFSYSQGGMKVLGYRFGNLAYVTDIKNYSNDIFRELEGLSCLVLSALRFTSSQIQFTIDEAIDFAEKVGAKKTYLMHLSHDIEYSHLRNLLPASITLAYDGLVLHNPVY